MPELPITIPVGTRYVSTFHRRAVLSRYEGKLTWRWGRGAGAYYIIPILGGHVCEWVPADCVVLV